MDKAYAYHPEWLGIRASYGMNGIFLRDKDLLEFSDYLLKHQARRPPDHLIVEWYAGETPEAAAYKKGKQGSPGAKANIGFRYNVFDHLGTQSTLREAKQSGFPTCYEQLLEPVVFEVEAFNPRQCPRDDIWPCIGVGLEILRSWPPIQLSSIK